MSKPTNPIFVAGCDSFKECPSCNVIKSLMDFCRNNTQRTGISSWCRQCNTDKMREKTYSITVDGLDALLKKQNYRCFICDTVFTKDKVPHVDHCHKSGKNRKLLCMLCNCGLGSFKDSSILLRKAADYLDSESNISRSLD